MMKKRVKKSKKNSSKPNIKVRKISSEEFEKNLEEIADEEQEFSSEQFTEFISSRNFQINSQAPALERIGGAQEIGWTRTEREAKEDEREAFRYDALKKESGEAKYQNTSPEVEREFSNIDETKVGRNFFKENVHEIQLNPSREGQNQNSMIEKYVSPERFDVEKAGRENPFETRFDKTVERKKSDYIIK